MRSLETYASINYQALALSISKGRKQCTAQHGQLLRAVLKQPLCQQLKIYVCEEIADQDVRHGHEGVARKDPSLPASASAIPFWTRPLLHDFRLP